jgi:hypothetical protein
VDNDVINPRQNTVQVLNLLTQSLSTYPTVRDDKDVEISGLYLKVKRVLDVDCSEVIFELIWL